MSYFKFSGSSKRVLKRKVTIDDTEETFKGSKVGTPEQSPEIWVVLVSHGGYGSRLEGFV